jgi:hypothetical protein
MTFDADVFRWGTHFCMILSFVLFAYGFWRRLQSQDGSVKRDVQGFVSIKNNALPRLTTSIGTDLVVDSSEMLAYALRISGAGLAVSANVKPQRILASDLGALARDMSIFDLNYAPIFIIPIDDEADEWADIGLYRELTENKHAERSLA